MTPSPLASRLNRRACAFGCAAGLLFAGFQCASVGTALGQAADETPAPARAAAASADRHLAPPGTFYLLSYVAVQTGTGVDGFVPGQEVHLVEAHRSTHTLVVSDGHAQVEVAPDKLTNDLDIAALVRRQDQANQARIAAYVQAEQTAFARHERAEAKAAAEEDARQQQAQDTAAVAAAQTQAAAASANQPSATPAGQLSDNASGLDAGYYGLGGYGYGSPYSYFVGPATGNRGLNGNGRGTLPSSNTGAGEERSEGSRTGGAERSGASGAHPGGGGRP